MNIIGELRGILEDHQYKKIKLQDNDTVTADVVTANAILTVYDAFQTDGSRDLFARKLGKSTREFTQSVDFVWRMIR